MGIFSQFATANTAATVQATNQSVTFPSHIGTIAGTGGGLGLQVFPSQQGQINTLQSVPTPPHYNQFSQPLEAMVLDLMNQVEILKAKVSELEEKSNKSWKERTIREAYEAAKA